MKLVLYVEQDASLSCMVFGAVLPPGGHVAEAGSFSDLMSAGLGFASLMKETQVSEGAEVPASQHLQNFRPVSSKLTTKAYLNENHRLYPISLHVFRTSVDGLSMHNNIWCSPKPDLHPLPSPHPRLRSTLRKKVTLRS
jgi:hypothetical protein